VFDRPWLTGKFAIAAGLRPLGAAPIFTRLTDAAKYLHNKQAACRESSQKYYPPTAGLDAMEMRLIASELRTLIQKDLPELQLNAADVDDREKINQLLCHVPEDFAVWKLVDGKEWLALIHLCSPNHWAAGDKIGKPFLEVHQPVPHINPISLAAVKFFEQVQRRGSVERFAWGVATDDRLNHHPQPPAGVEETNWKGRAFDPSAPQLFLRVERQTLFPINREMLGFTILTTFHNVAELPEVEKRGLIQAISGMDAELLSYKGLKSSGPDILHWLQCQL
jgi:hypothetical protein